MRILDPSRLARVPMIGIREHWSGGGHKANASDRKSYHVMTEGDGSAVYGVDIRLNSGQLKNGYAAHTRANNTGTIGHSMCGMMGAVENPFSAGPAPLTLVQWNCQVLSAADLCEFFKIAVARDKLLFHAEVPGTLGIAQAGKWDVVRLPFDPSLRGAHAIGDRFRDEVLSALRGNGPSPLPQPDPLPAKMEGATGRVTANSNLNFRRGPGTNHESVGSLPPGTVITVLAAQGDWFNVRTPAGHVGWVHGGYVQMLDTAPLPSPSVPDPLHAEIAGLRSRLDEIDGALPDDRAALAAALSSIRSSLARF